MVELLNDSRYKRIKGVNTQSEPKYYCINPLSVQHDFAFSHKEDLTNWIDDEKRIWGIENKDLQFGKLSEREDLKVVSVESCGGDVRVDNLNKIL